MIERAINYRYNNEPQQTELNFIPNLSRTRIRTETEFVLVLIRVWVRDQFGIKFGIKFGSVRFVVVRFGFVRFVAVATQIRNFHSI